MKHKKGKASKNFRELEVPKTIFNPYFPKETKPREVMYNRFTNYTFSLENAPIYEDEVKKNQNPNKADSISSKDSKPPVKRVMRQPGYPLIIELKSRKSKAKSKKPKLPLPNLAFKPRYSDGGGLSPVYNNLHGKEIYVMSAKLIKNVTITFPKSLLKTPATSYPNKTVEPDLKIEVKETVIHKKRKEKHMDENVDIYEKEYNTTSEYRRMKHRDNEDKEEEGDNEVKGEEDKQEVKEEDKDVEMKEEVKEEDKKEEVKEGQKEVKEGEGDKERNQDKDENGDVKMKDESKNEDGKEQNQESEKVVEEEEESDEEYSGEGCFIGYRNTDALRNMIVTPMQRFHDWNENLRHFKFITPKVRAKPSILTISNTSSSYEKKKEFENVIYRKVMKHRTILNSLKFTNSLYFPHRNLVQYDCGKLHKMSILLKTLKAKGSKVLIFTQMTKMLNLLEQFLNLHGYTYIRLDGSVKVEMRQKLVDTFNLNKKIFCFISSTRCGGIGINLTGAD